MSDLFAPWITDPDPPEEPMSSDDAASAAKALAEAFPDLIDRSWDGPLDGGDGGGGGDPPDGGPTGGDGGGDGGDDGDDDDEHEHDPEAFAKHRARFQKKTLKIHGQSLATWARAISAQDAERIATAISVGLTAGEDNTDIAHRVIGGRRHNGVNGMTEVTRQHIFSLGKGLLHKRKSRMSGSAPE